MAGVGKRLERPILHVLGNVVLAQIGIDADSVRPRASKEESARDVEHGVNENARVLGPAGPSRRIAGQTSQHREERKDVNIVFGGFYLVGAGRKVVAPCTARIKRVAENPVSQPDGSVQIGRDSRAIRQLRERHSGPGQISRGAAQKEKGEARGNDENSLRVRMVHEIGLAHASVRGGIGLLRIQQAVSQHFDAVQILSACAQQPSHDLHGVVVNERGALQSNFVRITLRKPDRGPLRVGVHHGVQEQIRVLLR